MKNPAALLSLSVLGGALLLSAAAQAETKQITNQGSLWKFEGVADSEVIVPVKVGDVIEFEVTGGSHIVMTLDKPGDQGDVLAAPQLVLACGENADDKKEHVLREIDCGSNPSQFGQVLVTGRPMRLEVTEKFAADVYFWCDIHTTDMWGVFKFTP